MQFIQRIHILYRSSFLLEVSNCLTLEFLSRSIVAMYSKIALGRKQKKGRLTFTLLAQCHKLYIVFVSLFLKLKNSFKFKVVVKLKGSRCIQWLILVTMQLSHRVNKREQLASQITLVSHTSDFTKDILIFQNHYHTR